MTPDPPDLAALVGGCAREAAALAHEADGGARQRLLVLAHAVGLAARELAQPAAAPGGDARAAELARAVREGRHDDDLAALARELRDEVRGRLGVARPGYDREA